MTKRCQICGEILKKDEEYVCEICLEKWHDLPDKFDPSDVLSPENIKDLQEKGFL